MKTIAIHLKDIAAKVKRGEIRNTVLRQIKILNNSINLLQQGLDIKTEELKEYRDRKPDKAEKLKHQIIIIKKGIHSIEKAMNTLETYKKTSVTSSF